MSRKDYALIARAVQQAALYLAPISEGEAVGVCEVANEIALALEADNPGFKRDRFLKACGLEEDSLTGNVVLAR